MGKIRKVFWGLVIFILLIAVAIAVYFLFLRPEKKPMFRYAPEDAFLMAYTEDFKESWEIFRESATWEIIQQQKMLDSSLKKINSLDSTIRQNKFINKLAENHSLLVSLHPVEKEGLKSIFYLDLMEFSKLRFSFDLLEEKLFRDSDYQTKRIQINGESVYEVSKEDSRYFLSFRDNVLFMSSSRELVKEVLKENENEWVKEEDFKKLDEKYRKRGDVQLYANFSMINSVLKTQKLDPEDYELWVNPLQYAVYNIEFKDDIIHLSGGISAKPESHGYLNAFSDIDIGNSEAYQIISKDIASYISFNFEQFNKFNSNFKQELAAIDSDSYSNYLKYFSQIEEEFDIDIEDHVFNWIEDEIVLGKLKPKIGSSEVSDLFVAIQTSNTKTTRDMMDLITEKVSDESPLKFRSRSYGDNEIKYLDIKGFFRLFAGNLFEKIERPYYTIVDDYVIFSNSVNNLITLLDHFADKQTLEYEQSFDDVYKNFDENGNVQLYINSDELYESVYYHTDAHSQKFLRQNRNLLMRMEALGIQVKPTEGFYESEIRIKLNTDTEISTELTDFEAEASKAENTLIENLEFKVEPEMMDIAEDSSGNVEIYYPDSTLWYEGNVTDGEPDELWRCYYETERMKSSVLYDEGKVEKEAVFYYDNEGNTIHIKAEFEDSKLIDDYKEFYENGQLKAKIPYKDGKAHGKALYYYPNGKLKMSGKFKNGKQKGKWKTYDPQGELIREDKH